ncbi:MAG: threonine synthase [Armatimonadetes bacterium]|nr:threonine synthase [Armatimonadota bacterium]
MNHGLISTWREFLPDVTNATPIVSLNEGDTPLIEAKRLPSVFLGAPNLRVFLKFEGLNPTGSFKDRGMTMAVSKAVERKREIVICASTGNTSAAAAAYAARAGIKCAVLLPKGEVALGKLAQALIHGAKVLAIDGNFDDALRLVREIAQDESFGIELVNSVNPVRIEGQKTAAFEIIRDLGDAPDVHARPVGNSGNITAYWRGFSEFAARGKATKRPTMLGFQAAGAAPLVLGYPVDEPQTIATAIRIGKPASWDGAISAREDSGGLIESVTDDEILAAYAAVASLEGVFAEPACAAPLAGLKKLAARGYFGDTPATVTVTLTGHGLKDPDRAVKTVGVALTEVAANRDAILRELLG